MSSKFAYTFPAIRGVQAGREYYVSMCPLRLIPRLFQFDEEELMPELRAQRVLNKARIPEITKYIVDNQHDYTFSAITASIDGDVEFSPVDQKDPTGFRMGALSVSMTAKFIVNDGQHRRAAIRSALQLAPELGDETIAVVFFLDRGLARCQQMFADLNRHAVKPSPSIGVLYDHRNLRAALARHLCMSSSVFRTVIEMEKTSLAERSRKLFTLSALDGSISELFRDDELEDFSSAAEKAIEFWELIGEQIPEWKLVRESKMTSGEVRRDFIHSHAITLQAFGRIGRALYQLPKPNLRARLKKLANIDWTRQNTGTWEGRAMILGRMEKSNRSVTLTTNEIKRVLGIPLTTEECAVEKDFAQTYRASKKRNS